MILSIIVLLRLKFCARKLGEQFQVPIPMLLHEKSYIMCLLYIHLSVYINIRFCIYWSSSENRFWDHWHGELGESENRFWDHWDRKIGKLGDALCFYINLTLKRQRSCSNCVNSRIRFYLSLFVGIIKTGIYSSFRSLSHRTKHQLAISGFSSLGRKSLQHGRCRKTNTFILIYDFANGWAVVHVRPTWRFQN